VEDVIGEGSGVDFADGADELGDCWLCGVGRDGKCGMDSVMVGYERRGVVNVRDDSGGVTGKEEIKGVSKAVGREGDMLLEVGGIEKGLK
jgi:hypothetical protein